METKLLKPWAIVQVNRGTYTHVGELVSFPCPGGTIMVRQVPGLAATAIELPLSAILQPVEIRWLHYAEVFGTTSFPVDMLRRENAAPADFDPEETVLSNDMRRHVIVKASTRRVPQWNVDRWKSFGWTLSELRTDRWG
jgi:hypothetical protein